LVVPKGAIGLVLFAHGRGSSRHSPRNLEVAAVLNKAGLATLLFNLLTEEDEWDQNHVFDVALFGQRLVDVTAVVGDTPPLNTLPIGYFGASTGAATALWAAASPDSTAAALVCRGGRPDLTGPRLAQVRCPTLLIVGGDDKVVLDLNRQAQEHMTCPTQLRVIPGATHLFEERGALRTAAEAARDWFLTHLN
jgi:putative phosphoribosyl transferase